MKNLVEGFEKIMEEIENKYNKAWYEVYDSELFEEVENNIVKEFGASVLNSNEYNEWEQAMYWDL